MQGRAVRARITAAGHRGRSNSLNFISHPLADPPMAKSAYARHVHPEY